MIISMWVVFSGREYKKCAFRGSSSTARGYILLFGTMFLRTKVSLVLVTCSVAQASLITTIVDALEQAVDCASCHTLLTVLQPIALLGDTIFSDALVGICEAVNVCPIPSSYYAFFCLTETFARPKTTMSARAFCQNKVLSLRTTCAVSLP